MFCPIVSPAAPSIDISSTPQVGPSCLAVTRKIRIHDLVLLLLLTFAALLVHGYHPWAEDAEFYLPGVEKVLDPGLFPLHSQFFQTHAHSTLFPHLIAISVRWSHLPLNTVLFVSHLVSLFLFLLAGLRLAEKCFVERRACWAGVVLIAALLTLPVAGTALYVFDQYLNPRNLAAFSTIFAIVRVLERRYLQAGLFLIFAAAIHPFMAVFAIFFCFLLVMGQEFTFQPALFGALLPLGLTLDPPSPAYHLAAASHNFHYLTRWHWYEWLGALAPIAILWWFSRIARLQAAHDLERLCRTLLSYELILLPVALVLSIPARLEALGRLQPMRGLYLLYILLFLFAGAFLGEYVLKNRVWRWMALFLPLCGGMFAAQRALFPNDAHIEWPGATPHNPWVRAFEWIRTNTPREAVFALDPDYMKIRGEDEQGFRAIAQRSRLADNRDSGAVSMFPALADEWFRQVQAQSGWMKFQLQDFRRLQVQYGVTWLVSQPPGISGLDCPYHNGAVLVCDLPQ